MGPSWQNLFATILYLQPGLTLFKATALSSAWSGSAYCKAFAAATKQQFPPTNALHSTVASTRGQLRQSNWKNGQLRLSWVSRLTYKAKFSLRLYCPTFYCFEPTTSTTEFSHNCSKGRGSAFSLRTANGLFPIQKLSASLLQGKSSSKLVDINRQMATN